MESNWSENNAPEYKREAAHIISGECERLFCDILSATFRGERSLVRQELLGMNACQVTRQDHTQRGNKMIQQWVEVWDYTSDAIYRGFVTDASGERTLFVFFEESTLGHGLKSGYVNLFFSLFMVDKAKRCSCCLTVAFYLSRLWSKSTKPWFYRLIALFELASMSAFDCSQIVACIRRSQDAAELEVVRNLGWCGFGLTTLKNWASDGCCESMLSPRWIFLSAEV